LQIAEQKEQEGEELTVKRISAGLQENTGEIRVSSLQAELGFPQFARPPLKRVEELPPGSWSNPRCCGLLWSCPRIWLTDRPLEIGLRGPKKTKSKTKGQFLYDPKPDLLKSAFFFSLLIFTTWWRKKIPVQLIKNNFLWEKRNAKVVSKIRGIFLWNRHN
jgi:hypothetical protein